MLKNRTKQNKIGANNRAKLGDMGLSRSTPPTEKSDNMFKPAKPANVYMTIVGTDLWMAPEVTLGMQYDEKCGEYKRRSRRRRGSGSLGG